MSADAVLARLRRFLLLLSGLLLAATVVELVFIGHTDGIQLLPFGLCALGLIAVAVARSSGPGGIARLHGAGGRGQPDWRL